MKLTHAQLIKLGKRLGYNSIENGLCLGFTCMFAQAILADDENEFWARLALIDTQADENFDGLISDIEHVKTKVRQKQILNENEKRLFEIAAFFDGVNLYLEPNKFIDLFGEWVNQEDLHIIHPFTKSVKQNNDTILLIFNTCGTFTKESFSAFIRHLEQQLRLHEAPNTPITISSYNHSICVKFDQNDHEQPWLYLDSNDLQQISLKKTNNTYCAKTHQNFTNSIFSAFTNNETLVVNVTVLSKTPSSELNLNLEEPNLSAYDSDGAGVLLIACQKGHTNMAKTLLTTDGIDINKTTVGGCTPLFIACQNGHTGIVNALLAKDGIEINITTTKVSTPLYVACQNGHTGIVNALLAKDGNDINKTATNGSTPLHIACQNGHTGIVSALLAKDGIDINKTATNGSTPLYVACQNGHGPTRSHR